jgi:diguanylate cyclase (GGDEF)-like protein
MAIFGGYVFILYFLEKWIGLTASVIFVVFPVIAAAWYYGIRWGLLTVLVSTLFNALLQHFAFQQDWNVELILGGVAGTIALSLLAIISGKISTLITKEKKDMTQRLTNEEYRLSQMQRQASQQAALFQLSTELTPILDEDTICRKVVDSLFQHLGYDYVGIYLVDPVTGDRVLKHSNGWEGIPDLARIPRGTGLTERPLLDGQTHYTPDVLKEPKYIPGVGTGSEIDLPILIGEKVDGVLSTEKTVTDAFNQSDFDVLAAAANLAGLALTRCRLFSAQRKQYDELSVLHAISMVMTETTNEDDLIDRATQLIGKNLFPDNFGITLLDETTGTLTMHSSYTFQRNRQDVTVSLGQGITGRVAQTGQPLRSGDVTQVKEYIQFDPKTKSELCVPLKIGKRVIGVINAESTKPDAFSDSDERIMVTLAGQLATTIEGLRSAHGERQRAAQLARSNEFIGALGQVAARIGSTPDLDKVLHTLGEELKKLDLNCLVALRTNGTDDLTIRFTSADRRIIRLIEKASGVPMGELRVPMTRLASHVDLIRNPEPVILTDPVGAIMDFLGGTSRPIFTRISKSAEVTPDVLAGHFPLMLEGKIHGLLWLWGGSLEKEDLPAMSVFADQVAVAIENARLFAEVQRLAVTDELTGLNNRRYFDEFGGIEFKRAKRYGRSLSAIFMDIDRFKDFNDTYGHAIGDQVLQIVGDVCKRQLREIDLLARYGGEEFVILLPETNRESAGIIAERLRKNIAETFVSTHNGNVGVTVSLGVVESNDSIPDLNTLIARADQALFGAKHKGRNRVLIIK